MSILSCTIFLRSIYILPCHLIQEKLINQKEWTSRGKVCLFLFVTKGVLSSLLKTEERY